MTERHISVIGGGLAGCAAALAADARGVRVTLYEQRPATNTPVHQTALPGELSGTADLGVEDTDRATGLLKSELRFTCPRVMECANSTRIGEHTLSVEREAFAQALSERLEAADGIDLMREQVRALPDGPVVIASGPSTWSPLAREIHAFAGADFRFSFIGRAPLIAAESVDLTEARWAPPYPGAEQSLYLPLTKHEAEELVGRLAAAERHEPPGLESEMVLADESRTAERLAADTEDRLRRVLSGPRGPAVELAGPALCLEPDDAEMTAFHLRGLPTSLSPDAQREALGGVGALSEVRIVRPGMIQRTPWLAGSDATLANLQLRRSRRAFVTGSLSGVYGYSEALALGAVAGIGAARLAKGAAPLPPPEECLTGALCRALSEHEPHSDGRMLQANFGMIPEHRQDQGLSKAERREHQEKRAIDAIERYAGAD